VFDVRLISKWRLKGRKSIQNHPMNPFSLRQRLKSFTYAGHGLKAFWRGEPHARIHLLAALLVVTAGFYFEVGVGEWLALVLVMALVITAELFNTALEHLANFISPDDHPQIKIIKDLAAAAVLVAAVAAAVVGAVVFGSRVV
jgi:diacylglycerol kinase